MTDTERTITVVGQTTKDLWAMFKSLAYREHDPVMLTEPYQEDESIIVTLKYMRDVGDGKRRPKEISNPGTLRAMPDVDGVRVTFRLGDFPDPAMFWQTVNDIVLEIKGLGFKVRGWLASEPPNHRRWGWNAVFEWHRQWEEETGRRMTLKDLATKLNYTYSYVRQQNAIYKAEHHD